ncbi:MFS transporter [Streptosporangium sp. NPDC004379]|uniref:MFS transporter n=1 Tax=Streptosporangium sp. NPDC004379 TaxID=3366189 RepID=UPI00369037AE
MRSRYRLAGYLAGTVAARTGDDTSGPALLLLGLSATGSVTVASSLLAGLTISSAVGGPVFGALLDRSPRPGRMLAGALAAYAAGLLVILLALGHVPTPALVGVAVLAGVLGPALTGGWTAQLPLVAGDDDLRRGSALDGLTYNVASLGGPALAGALATAAGAPAAVAVSIGLVLLAVPAAWTLPARSPAREDAARREAAREDAAREGSKGAPEAGDAGAAGAAREPLWRDMAAGLSAITRHPRLRRATLTTTVSFAGAGVLTVCAPLLGARLTGEDGYGTLLLSALAASALVANMVLARRPPAVPDRVILLGTLPIAAGSVLAAVAGSPATAVVAAVLAGLGQGPQLIAVLVVRHRDAPERLRGQVFTTAASLKISAFAVGSAVAGPLAEHSVPAALLTGAGVQLLAALVYLVSGPRSGQQLPGDRPHGLLVRPSGVAAGQPE